MMKKNVGPLDRILRIAVGLALIAGFFFTRDATYSWLFLVGIVPLVTGLMGSCGLYTLFGVSTCSTRS
ncbi:MAG: DUF2892 domain-containing protein [Pseudomonadota bacterium]